MLVRQVNEGRAEVENQYIRAVTRGGQRQGAGGGRRGVRAARQLRVARAGLGAAQRAAACARNMPLSTPKSVFGIETQSAPDNPACECGAILRGVKKPAECKLFGTRLHAGNADGLLHGLVRRRLRGALDLWAVPRCRNAKGERHERAAPENAASSISATAGSTCPMAPAAGPWRNSSPRFSAPPSPTSSSPRATTRRRSTCPAGRMVMTTDGYVVSPLFFPGGDIGSLAVHGTINDVAMAGARPLHLSASFILEEGFPLADLQRIAAQHGRGGARGGRADRHRRHQGGRARQGGRRVHLDRRHRHRARRARSLRRPGAAGRRDPGFRLDRRPWRRHHVEPREPAIRDADPLRLGRAARAGRRHGRAPAGRACG